MYIIQYGIAGYGSNFIVSSRYMLETPKVRYTSSIFIDLSKKFRKQWQLE